MWLFFCLDHWMKTIFLHFFLVLVTSCATAQKKDNMQVIQEFTFSTENFYKKVVQEGAKSAQIKNLSIDLQTPAGTKKFLLSEANVGEKRVPGLYTFRGTTLQGETTIALSLRPHELQAVMMHNSQAYYIEKKNDKTGKYLLYMPKNSPNQENDFLK